ncbi:MAG: histidine kinase [Flavobacterium haoranii]
MKIYYFLFILIVFISCKRSEENLYSNDKLDYHFNEVYNNDLSKEQKLQHIDSAQILVAKQNDEDSLKVKNLFKIANRYFQLLEYEKYKSVANRIFDIGKKNSDTAVIAKSEYYLGDYYFYTSKNDSAYYYYFEAEKKYKNLKNDFNKGNVFLHKALILLYERDFVGSEAQTIKAINIAKEINDTELLYECYANLGNSQLGLKNYNEALNYHLKGLDEIKNVTLENYVPILKAQSYNNIGHVYLSMSNYNKAKEYLAQGLAIPKLHELQPIFYSSLLDYYAYANYKLKNEAENDFLKALKIRDSINDTAGRIKSRIHLTEFYLDKKDTIDALLLNKQAYDLAKSAKYNKEVLIALDFYTKLDPKNGLKYAQEYIKLSDSLQEQERGIRNKLARIEFETDEILQEKEVLSGEKSIILLTSITILFIGTLLFIIFYLRSKQKQLVFANEQQLANERIYQLMLEQQTKLDEARKSEKKRIARELHDGIMNKLASTRLNLFVLNKKTDPETISKCLTHVTDIQNIEKEVRNIAHELSTEIFTQKNNFKSVLESLFQDQKTLFNANFNGFIDESIQWENLSTNQKMHLYRILQESLNNCNKYAEAQNISVSIALINNEIRTEIKDDGKGFNLKKSSGKGIGIQNMYDRTNEIGAELSINSKIGLGTTITLEIPYKS